MVEQAGVKTVINLRHDHDDYPLLAGTGMQYLWLPMRAWDPDTEEIVLFLSTVRRLVADPSRWPVYVHCAEGRDRTVDPRRDRRARSRGDPDHP